MHFNIYLVSEMKKTYLVLTFFMLTLISVVSSAATVSFWAYGSDDKSDQPKFLFNSKGSSSNHKDVAIKYVIDRQKWDINSAKFMLKAVDDNNRGNHCTGFGSFSCADSTGKYYDGKEYPVISKIDGTSNIFASKTEISTYGWYDLGLDVTSYLLNDKNNTFTARVKASIKSDYWYKNAKLVIDYDLKPVPVPAAIWLLGPALLGLTGLKRKPVAEA